MRNPALDELDGVIPFRIRVADSELDVVTIGRNSYRLVGEHLQWTGYYNQKPTRIYISAAQTATANGGVVYLYGSTTYGDPEQVAVWGGSATSPPQSP